MDSFWENRKKSKNGCFLAIFGLILAMFLTSQPYDFDAIAHAGAPLGVEWLQNFVKIVWTVFEKFEIFMKRSGEKKQHDCISIRKFSPTPKKCQNFHSFKLLSILKCIGYFWASNHSVKEQFAAKNGIDFVVQRTSCSWKIPVWFFDVFC